MKRKICRSPGCNALIPQTETYCDKHKREPSPPFITAIRSNNYNTAQWRQLRKKILKEQPRCFHCGCTNDLQVHHVIPPRGNEELFFDENNLVAVCATCHRILTSHEIRKRKKHAY
jgi:5-methylcytosine-specific restriction protein A